MTDGYDSNDDSLEICELTGERRKDMQLICCKVLSVVGSLAFRVCCRSTALWMDEFAKDVFDSFGDSDTVSTMSNSFPALTSGENSALFEVLPHITDKSFFEDNGVIKSFQASTRNQSSSLLANTVASINTRIAESMSKDDFYASMNCMAEANVCLLGVNYN